ncbi:3-hydroxybutyrate dehydrogenase [Lutibaculum baratangense]|uniref:D-beta-hydroxybutyrate dehydrogenase n=1 Tax=Lutibaculum baratangense AMV1 TaxID=631454 RepID=V4RLB4_9HYPH|nr:3-hydroxybutyrate dehydrogenase [Lutibaculum baratangense]ESR24020.1 D-beta-hydroxybutyrate dehydrogenase [Lutibaculum baratangense AMV1]
MSLHGKTALVTGSTSGIGLAIARRLAQAGADVFLNGVGDEAQNRALARDLGSEFGVRSEFSPADMSRPDEIEAMCRQALDAFGRIDILVNNAGIQHVAAVEEFPPEKWDQILAINLSSSFHTIRHLLPGMKAAGWGRIVNTASAHALFASPYKSAYVAAKHGIAGLTKTVALEVAQMHITVNAIAPGYVWTPLVERQVPDTARARGITEEEVKRDVILAAQPTKEFVTVEQVASLAHYLCSDDAKSITGTVISMDGGWSAQ